MNLTAALAAEIRAEMARQKISTTDLGEKLGVHRATAFNLTSGKNSLGMDRLVELAEILDVSVSTLLTRAEAAIERFNSKAAS